MWEAFYFILFASEAVGVICWPQGTWELLVVKFQPRLSVLKELLFLLTPQQDDVIWAFLVPLPTRVLKENLNTLAPLNSCKFLWGEGRPPWKYPMGQTGKGEPGPHSSCWSFPSANQAKLCFTEAKAAKAGFPEAAPGCAHWCNAHAEQPLQRAVPGPLTAPNQARIPEQRQPEQGCSIFPGLLPFPGHKTKQNKRHPAEKDGWMDWWFGLFCVFAFKWEGIIGGGGREKKQYWGGLVIFGAHLLEKWISLWIQKLWACSQEGICSMLHNHWTSFSYAISTSDIKSRA